MSESPLVRRLDARDADAWASLRAQALANHPLAFGATVPDSPQTLTEMFHARIADRESAIFGAWSGPAMSGIVGVRRHAGGKERHKAFIWGMYVVPEARRGGVAAALLARAVEQARSWQGVEQVQLAVSAVATEARRLYERHGFREWGREPRALCWDGRCADESHMVLDLREGTRSGG